MKWTTALLTAGGLLAGLNTLLCNRQLRIEEEVMYSRRLPQAFEGEKILLLADLHRKKFGKDYCILLDTVRAAQPDCIFFAGDLYSRDERELGGKVKLMAALNEIAPTYYAPGNHELFDPELRDAMICKLKDLGLYALKNERATIEKDGQQLDIYGLQLPERYFVSRNGSFRDLPVPTADTLTGYLGGPDREVCNLLIAHDPLFFSAYEEWGADLVFSGHVHGGMIRLPLLGGLLSPERKFFPKYSKGIYRLGSAVMAVTSGLGKLRVNEPPQLLLLTLTGKRQPVKRRKGHAWEIK